MTNFPKSLKWIICIILIALCTLGAVVYADNVQNDVVAGGNDTFIAGNSTTINYRIGANNGDGQTGCNAADATPATIIINVPASVIATPGSLSFTSCGTDKPVVFSSSTPGNYPITVSVSDSGTGTYNTNPAAFTLHVLTPPPPTDSTPPVITPTISGTLGNNGWYVSNVTVTWSVTDPESAITSPACIITNITADTAGTTATCSATSTGGTNSQSVTIKRDATAPTISGAASPAPNAAGWNNSDVTVAFTCADALSGVASCSSNQMLSTEGTNLSASGTVTDAAGNTASTTVGGIKIDKTAPTISGAPSPAPNANGWNNTDVTVNFTCGDALSGVATCTLPQTRSSEGSSQFVDGTATDAAGNTTSATVSNINIDKTAPTISGAASPAPNAAGWNNSDVTVAFTCADALAGIASCGPNQILSTEGTGLAASGTATDLAGNSASTSVGGIKIDKTAPTISASRSPLANSFGWNNVDVTVSYTCSDALSGGVICPNPQIFSAEGAGQVASAIITDAAGNSATAGITGINIDKTAPTISSAALPAPNAAGWNNTDVTVSFICADALSTVAACATSQTFSTEGSGQSASGTAIDKAGNNASASVTINIDKTAPTISASRTPEANSFGWNNEDVTVSFECNDALSGGITCPDDQIFSTEGEGQSADATITDLAGNSASVTVSPINIDKTAPTINAAASPAPNAAGWNNTNVTIDFTCSDDLSDIDVCATSQTLSTDGTGQSATGTAFDKAGNSASATVNNIKIDKTAPTINAAASPTPNAAGWNNTNVTVSFDCDDTLSGVAECSSDHTFTDEGTGLSTTGTATDAAGNSASTTVGGIKIDKTAPSISASRTPTANANGWNNEDVTVSFDCSDDLSGLGICPAPQTVSTEGAAQSVSGTASDIAGNSATASITDINIDKTAPTISGLASPAPNAAGWNNTDVIVSFTCVDGLAGIANCSPNQTLPAEGMGQSATGTALDKAGNSASTTVSNIKIDKTAPVVSVTGPANNASYRLGAVPLAGCSTSDTLSGVATYPTLTATGGNSAGVGIFTATCSGAVDVAGNTASTTITYLVTYNFAGFFSPVDNLPIINTVRSGSSVPVKFSLGGYFGLNIMSVGSPGSAAVSCSATSTSDAIEETVTAGNSSLSYDSSTGQYIYVWKTDRNWSSCRQLVIVLNDGTVHRAMFNFRR